MLTTQEALVAIPDPSSSDLPKTKLWSIAVGGTFAEAIQLRLLFWMFFVAFLMESNPVITGLPCLPVIKAETFPQPGDLLLASSGACDKMTQLLGAGLCLHVGGMRSIRGGLCLCHWPTCLVHDLLSGLPLAACSLQIGAPFKSERHRAFYL